MMSPLAQLPNVFDAQRRVAREGADDSVALSRDSPAVASSWASLASSPALQVSTRVEASDHHNVRVDDPVENAIRESTQVGSARVAVDDSVPLRAARSTANTPRIASRNSPPSPGRWLSYQEYASSMSAAARGRTDRLTSNDRESDPSLLPRGSRACRRDPSLRSADRVLPSASRSPEHPRPANCPRSARSG